MSGIPTINVQPLDSFRVGRFHLPIPCCLCGTDNLFDGIACRTCYAPLDITRIQSDTKTKCQLIATLGGTDVGKTVFLGTMLDILAHSADRVDHVHNDASSIAMQKDVLMSLSQYSFPDRTDDDARNWNWARCTVSSTSRKTPVPVFLVDAAGSAILRETDHPGSSPTLAGLFRKATGVFLVVDAARMSHGDKDEEYFARQIMTHLTGIPRPAPVEAKNRRRDSDPSHNIPPVAVILAKADQCDQAFDDPLKFLQAHMPGLDQLLRDFSIRMAAFAVSAVGATAMCTDRSRQTREFPLRVELRGLQAPFDWLLKQW